MPQLPSIKNSSGFTLLEVMVAIVIIMVGMLGLLEMISVSVQHNLKNQLRNEAVNVGERYMAELRSKKFTGYSGLDIGSGYGAVQVASRIRGINKNYTVERRADVLGSDSTGATSKKLTVTVKWYFKNQSSLNQVVSVVAKP